LYLKTYKYHESHYIGNKTATIVASHRPLRNKVK
jgi:hypothetical protein